MDAYKAEPITFRVKIVQRAMLLIKHFNSKNNPIKLCYILINATVFDLCHAGISKHSYDVI